MQSGVLPKSQSEGQSRPGNPPGQAPAHTNTRQRRHTINRRPPWAPLHHAASSDHQLRVGDCHSHGGDRGPACLLRQSLGVMRKQLITVTEGNVKCFIKLGKEKYINIHQCTRFPIHQALENVLIPSRNENLYMWTHIRICPNITAPMYKVICGERNTGLCLVQGTKTHYLGKGMLYYRSECMHAHILKPDAESLPDATV